MYPEPYSSLSEKWTATKRTIHILKESPHQSLKKEQKKEKDLVNSKMLRGENVTLSMTTSSPLI